jgi:hypothetical protein
VVRRPDLYHGAQDLAASLRYAWDESNLYLAYEVTDDTFVQENTGGLTWMGDALQTAYNLDPGKKEQVSSGNTVADYGTRPRWTEIELALTKKGPEAFRGGTSDPLVRPVGLLTHAQVQLAGVRHGDQTVYEAAIPWTTLGAKGALAAGDVIGLAATVNDLDIPTQLEPKALELFDGISRSKDLNLFGLLTLAGPPPAPAPAAAAP